MNLSLAVAAALLLAGAPDKTTPKPTSPSPNTPAQKPTRLQLATDGLRLATGRYQAGSASIEEIVRWCGWLYDAERAADAQTARAAHLSRLRDLEHLVDGRVQAGTATQLDLLAVRYLLASAEDAAK